MSEDAVVHQQLKVRDGLTVWRRGNGTVVKQSSTIMEALSLHRERGFLLRLEPWDYFPNVRGFEDRSIDTVCLSLEDFGDGEPVTSPWTFMYFACEVLDALKEAGIKHGDLTRSNIIVRDNMPHVIDFGEAVCLGTPESSKRAESDAYHLWQAVADILGLQP